MELCENKAPFSIKTLPIHQDFDPNKQEVFIGLKKKVYSLFKPSVNL